MAKASVKSVQPDPQASKRNHALIVDEDPRSRAIVEAQLQRRGLSLTAVADGRAALKSLAEDSTPSLVVLSMSLPDVSGFDVCRFIRKDPALRQVPVLIMSARSLAVDRACAEEAGASSFLTKPVKAVHLTRELDALLGKDPT